MKHLTLSIICSALVIFSTSARSSEYCRDYLKKNDKTGFSACEARNREADRSREQDRKQEEDRQTTQIIELERLELQRHQLELLKQQQRTQTVSELLTVKENLTKFEEAIKAGKCDVAKNLIDEANSKFKYSQAVKLLDKKDVNFQEVLVANQIRYFVECTNDMDKLEAYLNQEVKSGSKVAQDILTQLEAKRPKTLPNLSDYGTDMQSVGAYDDAINSASIKLCEEEYRKKSSDGAYCLAKRAESKEDTIRFYKEAASLGHPIAKNNLAEYYNELRKPELSPEIKQMMLSAAQSSIPHAQVSVGWWSMTGEHGFSKNYSEAMQWNLKAYKQGHSEGANNIGELYEKGLGVPKDTEQAKNWYRKSSVLGNKGATENLERLTR